MRQSLLFTKTKKQVPKDEVSKNAELLMRAGFIHKEMAGAYAFLPLGLKVMEKLKRIIEQEMDRLGAQQITMTTLQRKELWEQTDRWDDSKVDVWFKTALQNDTPLGLAWSHEEPVGDMLRQYITSYRDLPVYVYQFQTKLRNELRSKSGILRGREFLMKDMYSFSIDETSHEQFYQKVIHAYHEVFRRVGIGDRTFLTFASGGAFTQFSHEFQTVCAVGEDTIYVDREKNIAVNEEVYTEDILKKLGLDKKRLEKTAAIETGNIFSFGTMKSEQLQLYIKDKDDSKRAITLGSYGIGVSRLMGTIVEIFSDADGIVWPEAVAPFRIHLISLGSDAAIIKRAERFYNSLLQAGIEVLWDDRDASAGIKLGDADLIGIPLRMIISEKTGKKIEVKKRNEKNSLHISVRSALKLAKK